MNLLQLVNRARIECGVSAAPLATTAGIASEDQRVKNWVVSAWDDLQVQRPDWLWMKKPFTFATVAGQALYSPTQAGASDCADWKRDSLRCYSTATGFADEMLLPYMDPGTWRNVYQFGAMRSTTSRPVVFTVQPDKSIGLGTTPTAGYSVTGEYYRAPTALAADTDSPSDAGNDLAPRWHMLLVWMAMQHYAAYEAAPEVLQRAQVETTRLVQRLEFDQLPQMTFGAPLA